MAAGMPGTVMAIGFAVGAAVITALQNASGFVYHSMDVAARSPSSAGMLCRGWVASRMLPQRIQMGKAVIGQYQ